MVKFISSRENNKVKHAYSLKENKNRKEYKEFLAEGKKSLELALANKQVKEIFTLEELKNIPDDIPQYKVPEDILKKIAYSVNPEGVVFVCDLQEKQPKKLDRVIYLDHVSDPGNVGTIIRTALAFNYDAVILSPNSCDVYNEKVIAASKGAIFAIPVLVGELYDYSRDHTVIVSALDEHAIDLKEVKTPKSFILVVGNEAHGVTAAIIHQADIITKIAISNIDSLNVSIAAGILMEHLR